MGTRGPPRGASGRILAPGHRATGRRYTCRLSAGCFQRTQDLISTNLLSNQLLYAMRITASSTKVVEAAWLKAFCAFDANFFPRQPSSSRDGLGDGFASRDSLSLNKPRPKSLRSETDHYLPPRGYNQATSFSSAALRAATSEISSRCSSVAAQGWVKFTPKLVNVEGIALPQWLGQPRPRRHFCSRQCRYDVDDRRADHPRIVARPLGQSGYRKE